MDELQETSERIDTSTSIEQLEFLEFLKSLDDVPHDIGSVSNDGDETFSEPEPQRVAPQVNYSQPNELVMDAELAIPHITISMPHAQFLRNELGSDQVIPEINISFSNLPPASVATPVEIQQQMLPPTDRTKSELQQDHLVLQQHHFVHKLYLATSSHQLTFLSWTGQGQQLRLDYIGLQDHLSGNSSMFSSHNVQHFITHLLDIGFERMVTAQLERPQLCFEHKNFKAGKPELLLQLATAKSRLSQTHPPQQRNPLSVHSVTRTMEPQSPLQMARCRFQMLLQYHNDVRLLMQQEPSVEQILPRRGRISSGRQPSQLLQPALAAKHVNPRDSVLQFEVGQVPEYAGFYGRAEPALISEFFAEYLPRYGSRVSGYKDIVVDASKANSFQQNLPIGVVYSEDEEELEALDCPIEETKIASPELATNSVPEDIELEQVMQELCGIVPEAEKQLDKKNTMPALPKLKRKKSEKKGANVEIDAELESSQEESTEDLIQTLSAPLTSPVKDEPRSKAGKNSSKAQESSKAEAEKDSKSPKREVKRRRYDLRNSKSKRSN